jgi:hypothetical protein
VVVVEFPVAVPDVSLAEALRHDMRAVVEVILVAPGRS